MGQESFAGITVPAGDPGQLRDLAAGFNGAGGAVGQCASGLQALPPQLASWQGLASLSFDLLCTNRAGMAMSSASALSGAAQTATGFADALDAAQKQARAAIARAQDATRRISAAQAAQADAQQRMQVAAASAQQAQQSLAISTLMAAPNPAAQQAQAQAQADGSAAQADGQQAQSALQAAQQELHDAQAQGKRAEQAAHQASQAAASSFYAIAGSSPTPVAPGPPAAGRSGAGAHKHDDSLLGDLWGTVKDGASAVAGFGGDTLKGLGDFAGGLKDVAVMAYKLSPVYGIIDPNGQMQGQQQLLHGLEYGAQHPGEFAKALVDWKDITNGHPGRAFGQLLPNVVLAVASGGAGAAAKGADAANVVSKLGTTTKTTDALGATTRAADAANATEEGLAPIAGKARTVSEALNPGGQLIGQAGSSEAIRIVRGGQADAEKLFSELSTGGGDMTPAGHPGEVVELPNNGGYVGYRPFSKSGPPTIDVNVPGQPIREIKFIP